jgi:hypothetical protein
MRERIVTTLAFLVEQLITAKQCFYSFNQLEHFDPHVGESACQIRAYQLLQLTISKDEHSLDKALAHINELKTILEKLAHLKELNWADQQIPNNKQTVDQLLKDADIYFDLSTEDLFLIGCYFLTSFKQTDTNDNISINYLAIAKELQATREYAKKLVRYYQRFLSRLSCELVFEWARAIDQGSVELTTLKKLQRTDDDGRPILPFYYFTEILLQHLVKQGLSILVIIFNPNSHKQPPTFLKVESNGLATPLTYPATSETSLSEPYFIVSGESQLAFDVPEEAYLKKINEVSFFKVLLLNTAAHPQYSGTQPSSFEMAPSSLTRKVKEMAYLAEQLGCCLNNPNLFFVKHIYCDTIKNQIKKTALPTKNFRSPSSKKTRQSHLDSNAYSIEDLNVCR